MANILKRIFTRKQKAFSLENQINQIYGTSLLNFKDAALFPAGFLGGNEGFSVNTSLSPHISLQYYRTVAPVALAVDRVTEEFATIPPAIENQAEQFIPHPVLELLKRPNAQMTQDKFLKGISTFFYVTGEVFIMATGNITRPPLELFVVNPAQVTVDESGIDDFPGRFTIDSDKISFVFERVEINGQMRFVHNSGDRELWHIKDFSPVLHSLRGFSPLTPLGIEIEQYLSASIHNNSLLKRGTTVGGIFTPDNDALLLSQDKQNEIRNQIKRFYTGAKNAGRAFLSMNLKFTKMTQSNLDMDFDVLRRAVFDTIVAGLKVPLPLVSADTMTLNNLENSVLTLYDNAVIPLAKGIFKELTLFLMPRYPNSNGLQITFEEGKLPALEPRRNAELNKIKDLNVLTLNEIRQMLGRDDLKEGGDDVYISATLIPVSEAASLTDPSTEQPPPKDDDTKLIDIVNSDGKPLLAGELLEKAKAAYGDGI